ncbi:MAG: AAA family ATPase [Candidatus Tectomicrobia bacterium]|uniref:AAA family ATPase n=1 Tax=Tectimicrobiota bacterium TaxID=2528274 RepID=A0A933GL80_UNCTE|nr:AAA family ATPase [Candidatus Tectomicrobia bacterium]
MKLAIAGKGGVGKTTLTALLAHQAVESGYKVLAVDADPDSNLAGALGLAEIERLAPISEMHDLIEERTGAKPGSYGTYFKLNPKVDDIPDRFCLEKNGVKLMVMGTVAKGGGGCICPESTLLKTLMGHLLIRRDELVILDMEAGIEHLGRGTAQAVDALLVVIEPSLRAIETSARVKKLAEGIGIRNVWAVGNKVRSEADYEFIRGRLKGIEILGFIPFRESLLESSQEDKEAYTDAAIKEALRGIFHNLQTRLNKN